jgi:YhcN/YlaJ family sporulation lipoprotein
MRKIRFMKCMNPILTTLTILLFAIVLMGCQSKETKKFESSSSDYGSRHPHSSPRMLQGNQLYGASSLSGNHHENKKLEYSTELSTALSDMNGVYSGLVMVTDKNAYAAFMFDNSATGSKGRGTPRESNYIGSTRGMYDTRTGNQTADPNQIATGINTYFTEKSPANLSSEFKQQIALTLREKNPQLEEVYITANRDFINQMNVYYTESMHGVDLNHYLNDFNELVKQHFGTTE